MSMRLLIRGRQSGKTTRLLDWLENSGPERRVLVCHSWDEVRRLERLIANEGRQRIDPEQITSVDMVLSGRSMMPRGTVFAVDNLDLILGNQFTAPIAIATGTDFDLV